MTSKTRLLSWLLPGLFAAACVAAAETLESFETDAYPGVTPSGCTVERVQEHASDGASSLKVLFPGNAKDTWPGLSVSPPERELSLGDVFVVDVYNPLDEPVYLSYRVDAAEGPNTFGSQTLGGRSWTKVEIWTSWLANTMDVADITRFYPYLRMPREDRVLYFDHFRIEMREARFNRLAYLEIATAPQPTPHELAAGCCVFRRGELGHVFPNSVPWPGERAEAVHLFAAQGEVEPVALSIRTLSDLDTATLAVSSLVSERATLPEGAVEIGCVRHLDKKVTYASQGYIAAMPAYVEACDSFEHLRAGTTATFWIRFRLPPDATPGLYRGEVLLQTRRPGGEGALTLPLSVRVLPFSLPEPRDYFIGEYYRPWGYATDDAWKDGVAADLADMRDHGMTSVGLCIGLDTAKVSIADGRVDLGFDGATRFEHFMDTYAALGFAAPVVMLSDSGQAVAREAGDYGTAEYSRAYKAFWQAVQETCRQRGWPELIVQPVDEPGWQDDEAKDRNLSLLKLLKEIPGMRTEQDGPGDGYFTNVAGPFADMWNYNGAVASFDKVRQIRNSHLVAIYNNDVESYRPEVDRYAAGFFLKAAGIDGVFNWEYRGGRGSLYDDLDGPSGDWVHNYPATDSSNGGPSVAWEGAREGVDDLRYALLFDAWRAKGRSHEAAAHAVEEADGLWAYLMDSLAASPGVRGRAQWTARWSRADAEPFGHDLDPDATGFLGGILKQPNGWGLRDYQRARWAIARSVLELERACGAPVEIPTRAASGAPRCWIVGHTPYPECAQAAKADGPTEAAVVLPRLAAAPAMDGDLDEAAWGDAFHIEGFVPNTEGDPVEARTEAYVGWHGEHLYVGVRCEEPFVKNLVAECMEDGEPVWMDDCIEIFFDPGVSRATFAQLAISSRGVQWSRDVEGAPWPSRVPVQTAVGDNEWRLEAAVPLNAILARGVDFGLNLCRERRAGGGLELSSWRATGGQFGEPSRFSHVRPDHAEGLLASLAPVEEDRLKVRAADALALTHDTVVFDVEWTGDRALAEQGDLRVRVLAGDAPATETAMPWPRSGRARVVVGLENLQPGLCQFEVALVGPNGEAVASIAKPCLVIPAPAH